MLGVPSAPGAFFGAGKYQVLRIQRARDTYYGMKGSGRKKRTRKNQKNRSRKNSLLRFLKKTAMDGSRIENSLLWRIGGPEALWRHVRKSGPGIGRDSGSGVDGEVAAVAVAIAEEVRAGSVKDGAGLNVGWRSEKEAEAPLVLPLSMAYWSRA